MWFATWFKSGKSPYAPGTIGTLAAVPLVIITGGWSLMLKLLVFILLFVIGIAAAEYYEVHTGEKDPSAVVIDEVAAYYLIMMFFSVNFLNITASFILFRIFDIFKPYPIKNFEKIKGGVGIMLDDIIAALYSLIFMIILVKYYG